MVERDVERIGWATLIRAIKIYALYVHFSDRPGLTGGHDKVVRGLVVENALRIRAL
jgi:hypothetical protein